MVTISEGEISHQLQTTLPAEMDICLDDELEVAGRWVRVRRMQTETGDLRAGLMENVKHLWVQAYDQIAIGFSITRGDTTESFDRSYPPETLFVIGRPPPDLPDRLIIRIKTRDRVRRRGSVQARDISRVYLQA